MRRIAGTLSISLMTEIWQIMSFIIVRSADVLYWKLCKMWGEATQAPYGKISIGTVRGGKGRICANTAK